MRNYFNYFTEVEEHFSRLRGRHLFVSPMDWCLIDLWKESRIPLHVVLRGIDRSFEGAASRGKKLPRTLYYCHPAVTEAFEQHQAAHVGAGEEDRRAQPAAFTREQVERLLEDLARALSGEEGEGFERARSRLATLAEELHDQSQPDYEEVDRSLSHIGGLVAGALLERQDPDSLKDLRKQIRKDLRVYRKHLAREAYAELFENYLKRRVIEDRGLPGFSLFDLESSL